MNNDINVCVLILLLMIIMCNIINENDNEMILM